MQSSRLFAAGLALATCLGLASWFVAFGGSQALHWRRKGFLRARHHNTTPMPCQNFRSAGCRRLLEQDPCFRGRRCRFSSSWELELVMGMTAFLELLHWHLASELPAKSLKLLRISFSQGCMKSPVLLYLSFSKHHAGQLGQDCVDAGLLQARESFSPNFPGRPYLHRGRESSCASGICLRVRHAKETQPFPGLQSCLEV